MAITLIYLGIDGSADDSGVAVASTSATVAAIVLALVKLRIIMREFMDVRHAPRLLRSMTDVLVAVMAVALLGTYLVGKRSPDARHERRARTLAGVPEADTRPRRRRRGRSTRRRSSSSLGTVSAARRCR